MNRPLLKSRQSPQGRPLGDPRCVAKCHHPWEGTQRQLPRDLPLFKGLTELQGTWNSSEQEYLGARERVVERRKRSHTVHIWSKRKKSHCREVVSSWVHARLCCPLAPDGDLKRTQFCQPLGGSPTILFYALITPQKRAACLIRVCLCHWMVLVSES